MRSFDWRRLMVPRARMLGAASFARRRVREFTQAVLDCVTVASCPGCGTPERGGELCRPCGVQLQRLPPGGCPRCGLPTIDGARCGESHDWLSHVQRLFAPFEYAGTGGALVRRLKFQRDRAAGSRLAVCMAEALTGWARSEGRRALVVPVPLHWRKRRARGVDQAVLLGRAVARRLDLRFDAGVLRRCRDTLPQGDPRVTSRVANLEGAFGLGWLARWRISGRNVVLVDDVVTSGTTARECARLLRGAGARSVVLLVGCRARR